MVERNRVERLDRLIDEIAMPQESECELLREHLESARTYLLGSMPLEYSLTLQLANQVVNCISNRARRERVKKAIDDLLAEQEVSTRK